MPESASITGRWRITEMDNWDQEAIDLVQPGFIEFGEDGLGSLGFIVVTGNSTAATRILTAGRGSSSHGKAPTRATTRAAAAGPRSISTARSRATSTSISVTIPGSAPSGSMKPSGERPRRSRDGGSASPPPNVAKYRQSRRQQPGARRRVRRRGCAGRCPGASGPSCCSYRASPAAARHQASSVADVTGKTSAQRWRGTSRASESAGQ